MVTQQEWIELKELNRQRKQAAAVVMAPVTAGLLWLAFVLAIWRVLLVL